MSGRQHYRFVFRAITRLFSCFFFSLRFSVLIIIDTIANRPMLSKLIYEFSFCAINRCCKYVFIRGILSWYRMMGNTDFMFDGPRSRENECHVNESEQLVRNPPEEFRSSTTLQYFTGRSCFLKVRNCYHTI